MVKEYEVITDLFNEQNKCIKKNVIYKKLFETNDMHIESYIEKAGKVINKYTGVIYNDKYYKINKPFDELSKDLKPVIVEGFIKSKPVKTKFKSSKVNEEDDELPEHLEQNDDDSELKYIIEADKIKKVKNGTKGKQRKGNSKRRNNSRKIHKRG